MFSALAVMLAVSCQKSADTFNRDTDKIKCTCIAQGLNHYVCSDGDWTIECNEDWVSFEPNCGSGNGVDFEKYVVNVTYNHGAERTATYNIVHNGKSFPVVLTQGACSFAYGSVKFAGTLMTREASAAKVNVAYTDAAGDEKVKFTVDITGAGAAGLSVAEQTVTLAQGSGTVALAVTGTPTTPGAVTFAVKADGKAIGSVKAEVVGKDPVGLPCGWNFYAKGFTGDTASSVKDTPEGQDWIPAPHKVHPTVGNNSDAYFTAVAKVGTLTNWTFNPSIQAQGLLLDDYWEAVIPVRNFEDGTKITVEMGCGGAGGSIGFYLLEYSADEATWTTVDGAQECKRGDDTFLAHLWNTPSSISTSGCTNTRKTYDKATDDTHQIYTFPLKGITNGNLYLRLRAIKYRASKDATTAPAAGWTDIKGFEVTLAE